MKTRNDFLQKIYVGVSDFDCDKLNIDHFEEKLDHGDIAILNNSGEISEETLADLQENSPLTFYHGNKAYDLVNGKLVEHEI